MEDDRLPDWLRHAQNIVTAYSGVSRTLSSELRRQSSKTGSFYCTWPERKVIRLIRHAFLMFRCKTLIRSRIGS